MPAAMQTPRLKITFFGHPFDPGESWMEPRMKVIYDLKLDFLTWWGMWETLWKQPLMNHLFYLI